MVFVGFDAGKKVNGRTRHIHHRAEGQRSYTSGFLAFILVHAADIQNHDVAIDVLNDVRFRSPWLRHVFADGSYAGEKLSQAIKDHGD